MDRYRRNRRRDLAIVAEWNAGAMQRDIAVRYGLTREAVSAVLQAARARGEVVRLGDSVAHMIARNADPEFRQQNRERFKRMLADGTLDRGKARKLVKTIGLPLTRPTIDRALQLLTTVGREETIHILRGQ